MNQAKHERHEEEEKDSLLPPSSSPHSHDARGNRNGGASSKIRNYSSLSNRSLNGNSYDDESSARRYQSNDSTSKRRKDETKEDQELHHNMPFWTILCILSTAFSYGCILTTLFLITLPMECERIHLQHSTVPKSVALGAFVAIAGITQLISPLVGHLSDTYIPPVPHELGQRLPYLMLGSVCTVAGLLGQMMASALNFWVRYSLAFFVHMIGLNVMYAMMLALIPDQVPSSQTGTANGVLALLLVTGSLFGFGLFHSPVLAEDIHSMYGLYTCIVIVSSILTGTHAHDKDAELTFQRTERQRILRESRQNSMQSDDDDNNDYPERSSSTSLSAQAGAVGSPALIRTRKYKKWHRVARKVAKSVGHKAKEIVLTPTVILRTMLVDPLRVMDGRTLLKSYTIDTTKHFDFFVVTVSRLFYYCGMSVQTFFLYYLHDIIGITDNPEATVASLAILGQISGALTCYPVGLLSDRCFHKRRKPFVYLACAILSSAMAGLLYARTLHQMAVLCFILGGANGIYLTMDTSLAVDTLPRDDEDDEDEDSHDDENDGDDMNDDDDDESSNDDDPTGSAQLLGIWGVAAFLGSALGPMIGGPLLYLFGRQDEITADTDEATGTEEYSMRGYAVVIGLASFYFVCSALSLTFTKNI